MLSPHRVKKIFDLSNLTYCLEVSSIRHRHSIYHYLKSRSFSFFYFLPIFLLSRTWRQENSFLGCKNRKVTWVLVQGEIPWNLVSNEWHLSPTNATQKRRIKLKGSFFIHPWNARFLIMKIAIGLSQIIGIGVKVEIPKSYGKDYSHTISSAVVAIACYFGFVYKKKLHFVSKNPGDKSTSNICAMPRSQFLVSFYFKHI